jgi:hypothetical protein
MRLEPADDYPKKSGLGKCNLIIGFLPGRVTLQIVAGWNE